MTLYLPLDPSATLPQSPHFLVPSAEPTSHVQKVVKAILKAKRIAVLCGAGISVNAGIPDFRSETGLFQTLKKDHTSLSSGKDLFDASVFNSEATTTLFCKMIAGLADLAKVAEPTAFHQMLRTLDDRGRLLRVYTQNIDALEMKAGLTFGVPELDAKRKPRSTKGTSDSEAPIPGSSANSTDRMPTPPAETPRCIPLHGTLQSMHCQICLHSFPLDNYMGDLNAGTFPICPDCSQIEETRQAVGKRSRGVGKLRPSVVLYNEMHKDGEEVGEVVRKDLVGSSKGKGRTGADLLIVVGTSLRVPGTKRMVREFSKAIHSRAAPSTSQAESSSSSAGPSSTRRSPVTDDDAPIKTIYLNLDFPVPTREWEGVFDVWIRGDAQSFAKVVQEEIEREDQAREAVLERKKRREEMKLKAEALAQIEAQYIQLQAQLEAEKRKEIEARDRHRIQSRTVLVAPKRQSEQKPPGPPPKKKKTSQSPPNCQADTDIGTFTLKFRRFDQQWKFVPSNNAHTPPTPPPSQGPHKSTTSSEDLYLPTAYSSPLSSPPLSPPTYLDSSSHDSSGSISPTPSDISMTSSLTPCPSSPRSPPHFAARYSEPLTPPSSAEKYTTHVPIAPSSPLTPLSSPTHSAISSHLSSPPPSPPSTTHKSRSSTIPPSLHRRQQPPSLQPHPPEDHPMASPSRDFLYHRPPSGQYYSGH